MEATNTVIKSMHMFFSCCSGKGHSKSIKAKIQHYNLTSGFKSKQEHYDIKLRPYTLNYAVRQNKTSKIIYVNTGYCYNNEPCQITI